MNLISFSFTLPGAQAIFLTAIIAMVVVSCCIGTIHHILNFGFRHSHSRVLWVLIVVIFNIAGILGWWALGPRKERLIINF